MYSVTITDAKGVITFKGVRSFEFGANLAYVYFANGSVKSLVVRDILDIQIVRESITVSTNGQKENN